MEKKRKSFLWVIGILVVIVAIVFGIWLWQQEKKETPKGTLVYQEQQYERLKMA